MEKKQINRVDTFLDSLNKTVMIELRNFRTQYDQIWQSTVIALETQREQSQREIVALSSRLNVLADEVVFQKRMAILQSVLLLACLLLVIFSRGSHLDMALHPGSGSAATAGLPASPPPSDAADADEYGSPPSPTRNNIARHTTPGFVPSVDVSYRDKTLPLTPDSEYEQEATRSPSVQADEMDVPSFENTSESDSEEPTFTTTLWSIAGGDPAFVPAEDLDSGLSGSD
jgi:hypothetical protein